MIKKLSLKTAEDICETLGKFADARLKSPPDKDTILIVKKVDGRKTLQVTQLSQMKWFNRIIRRLGLGGATLKSVAEFLQQNEPYLPPRFADLKTGEDLLKYHYRKNDIPSVLSLQKDRYQHLKDKKSRGYDVFSKCLAHHNEKSTHKLNTGFEESHKIDLSLSNSLMGLLPLDKDAVQKKYKHPNPLIVSHD